MMTTRGSVRNSVLRLRPNDSVDFKSHRLASEVFLAPFDHTDYPNNLDEKRKDRINFGRYRVVRVRENEVSSTAHCFPSL